MSDSGSEIVIDEIGHFRITIGGRLQVATCLRCDTPIKHVAYNDGTWCLCCAKRQPTWKWTAETPMKQLEIFSGDL